MNKKILWLIAGVVTLAVVLVGALFGYKYLSKLYLPEKEGGQTQSLQKAEDFTVLNEKGESESLSSKFGNPVVVNFWATWCGPCQSEMPAFDTMYREYGEQIVFMMVNLTDGARDTKESALRFVKDKGYRFPVYFDTTLSAADTYGAYSIPMTVFINAKGQIVATHRGAMSEQTLENYIKEIL